MIELFILLVLFQLKHFFADYVFQNTYMLGKFKETGWFLPLFSHVLTHGLFTLIIASVFATSGWVVLSVVFLDMIIHFVMDRFKASPKLLGRYNITEKPFWWSLGLDQMVHHLTHYLLIAIIIFV